MSKVTIKYQSVAPDAKEPINTRVFAAELVLWSCLVPLRPNSWFAKVLANLTPSGTVAVSGAGDLELPKGRHRPDHG